MPELAEGVLQRGDGALRTITDCGLVGVPTVDAQFHTGFEPVDEMGNPAMEPIWQVSCIGLREAPIKTNWRPALTRSSKCWPSMVMENSSPRVGVRVARSCRRLAANFYLGLEGCFGLFDPQTDGVLAVLVLALQPIEADDLGVDLGLFNDHRIAGGDGLDLLIFSAHKAASDLLLLFFPTVCFGIAVVFHENLPMRSRIGRYIAI